MTVAVPVNERHQKILYWLLHFGLEPDMDVYEIGCGTGSVTALIADQLGLGGSLLAVDIDRDRVAQAKQLERDDVLVLQTDATRFDPASSFDVIVLPDVLEHIPADRHAELFGLLAKCLRPGGFVFIHMPNPPYLAQLAKAGVPLQQPVDEPVPTRELLDAIEPASLYLHHLETYTIWDDCDYQAIMLRHATVYAESPLDCDIQQRPGTEEGTP